MKTIKFYATTTVIALCAATIISCSPDEDITPDTPQERGDVTTYNQVRYLQDNIVELDSLGNFEQRVNGAPLNPADTTELYIGVANLAEAAEMFQGWLSPDTEVKLSAPSTVDMEAGLKDEDGQLQEMVYFKVVDEAPTLAEVTFAKGTAMKHVSKIIFIKDSAWPENDESKWLIGDFLYDYTYNKSKKYKCKEDKHNWVCIRESKKGVSGMFLYISCIKGYWGEQSSFNFASQSTAEEASEILRKDWDMYVSFFDEAGAGKLEEDEYYWINRTKFPGIYSIRFSDGDVDWWDIVFKSPKHSFIQIKTF